MAASHRQGEVIVVMLPPSVVRLTDELLSEAPAIFNWALDGLDRLNAFSRA